MKRAGTAVAVISKVPRLGATKTRLAVVVGAQTALSLHVSFLQDELGELARPDRWSLYLVHDAPEGAEEEALIADLLGDRATSLAPGRPDLPSELLGAFEALLERHERAVIVSADVPQIDAATVAQAMEALSGADVVLGPGPDGGYYLVGLKAPHDIFTPIAMGTGRVERATRALCKGMGLAVGAAAPLTDMDEAQDLLALEHAPAHLAPRTRAALASLERGEVAPTLPRDLQVEVTSRCNLECTPCLRTHTRLAPDADLTLADFERVIAGLPQLARVAFQLNGEPLLCADLFAMVEAARHRGAAAVVNTNGILLDEVRGRKLLASGIDEVRVSFHGARAATHDRIAGASVFDRLTANVRRLAAARGAGSTARISLWIIAMRDTLEELVDLVRLASDLGADEVYLQRLVLTGAGDAVDEQSVHGRVDGRVHEILDRAEATAAELGVALRASGRKPAAESLAPPGGENPWLGCYRPWRNAVVTASLEVLPCCIASFRAPYEVSSLGSLRTSSWEEIWNGDRARRLRGRLLAGDPTPFCAGCTRRWSL